MRMNGCAAPFAGLAVSFIAIACPAEAREVKGALAYLERIALSADAEIAVDVREGDRVVAHYRQGTAGAQVPVPFALDVPQGTGQVLQGRILVEGTARWTSAAMPLPAGSEAVDLGVVRVSAFPATALPLTLDCGGEAAVIALAGDGATLTFAAGVIGLSRVPAPEGTRFSDGARPETAVWIRDRTVAIRVQGRELPDCRQVTDGLPVPMVARGNEPGWVLNVTGDGVAFSAEDGTVAGGALPPGEEGEAGIRYAVAPDLAFVVQTAVCRDSMTGMPFPLTVLVEKEGQMLNGCGGDPVALLSGDWSVTRLGDAAVAHGAGVTMSFGGGRIFGRSGCNRYTGPVELTGENLRLGPVAGTRMACPGAAAAVEQAFLAALARIDRFDLDENGDLLLMAGDTALMVARHQTGAAAD